MTLRNSMLRRRDAGSVQARIAQADAACRDRRWGEAASGYASVAAKAPGLQAYWVSTGNCLKDAQQFQAAFDAYRKAYVAVGPTGDLAVQMGHLFKQTGNFRASLEAYRWAERLGDAHGRQEIDAFPGLHAGVVRLRPPSGDAGDGAVPLSVFHALWACDVAAVPDPAKLRGASQALEACGEPVAARAFAQVAFLVDAGPQPLPDHIRHVVGSPLWPTRVLKRLQDAQAHAAPCEDGLAELAFVAAAISETIALDPAPKPLEWPPRELSLAHAQAMLARLSALTSQAHDAIAFGGEDGGGEAIAAVRALHDATSPAGGFVAFATAPDRDSLTRVCARMLHDALAVWLARAKSRYLEATTSAPLVSAFLARRANPLALRVARGDALQGLAYEIDGLLRGALRETFVTRGDAARAALFAVCSPEIPQHAARAWLAHYRRPDAPLTCAALIAACHAGRGGGENEIVAQAQDLKAIGSLDRALSVLSAGLDENAASRGALIEWALIAKINGDFARAARLFAQAYRLEPTDFLRRELVATLPEVEAIPAIVQRFIADPDFLAVAAERTAFRLALESVRLPQGEDIADLAPEIAAELRAPAPRQGGERIEVLELGRGRRWDLGQWRRQLRSVDFVRVRVASAQRLTKLRVRLDGRTVGETPGAPLQADYERSPLNHTIFNAWFDLSGVSPGAHELQLYFEEWDGGYRTWEEIVWFDGLSAPPAGTSASIVELGDAPPGASLEARIAALPSLNLPAKRQTFEGPIDKILVVRADQLGDTVMSIPAILALKRHFPEAELHGLFSPAQRELMASVGVFAHIHDVDFRYDQKSRTRNLTLDQQSDLKQRLTPHRFDWAIDLSPGVHSRPLLRLAGARHTAGFRPADFPWMTFGIDVQSRDPGNGHACLSHSHAPESLVESLALAIKRESVVLPRAALDPEFAAQLGLAPGRRFAVIHAGARTESRKWPVTNFCEVARRLVREVHLFVVLMLDCAADLPQPPEDLAPEDFVILSGAARFDHFDGLLSQAAVFIGNDTGPKHLAALRGTPVVSLHLGAVNWNEWGQDGSGVILTRRAPCYGCGIELSEECGRGRPCLLGVTPAEVVAAASPYLA